MLMLHGESCGINGDRQVKLKFVCDNGDDLIKFESITEPQICKYEILLKTPLVCSQFSLNVYPTLNRTLQHEWDLAYSEYSNQLITEKVKNENRMRLMVQFLVYKDVYDHVGQDLRKGGLKTNY